MAVAFLPDSVVRSQRYGEVDPFMIDVHILDWAAVVSRGDSLSAFDRSRLQKSADELERSLAAFDDDARPYYERLLRIAHLALSRA